MCSHVCSSQSLTDLWVCSISAIMALYVKIIPRTVRTLSLRSLEQSCISICRMTEQNQSPEWLSHQLQTLCWWLPDFCLSRSRHKRGDQQPWTEIRTLSMENRDTGKLASFFPSFGLFCGSDGVTNNALLSGFYSQWPFLLFFLFFFRFRAQKAKGSTPTEQCECKPPITVQ